MKFLTALNFIQLKMKKYLNIGYKLPFSPFRGILRHIINKSANTVLDIGCGTGSSAHAISRFSNFVLVGIDLFLPHIKFCKEKTLYNDNILCDALKLPFKKKSFDITLAIDLIEHFSKEDGLKFIRNLEEISRKQIIISTPVGFMKMFHRNLNSNRVKLEKHRSGWTSQEFERFGFKVFGNFGPKFLPRDISYWLSHIFPFTYFIPKLAYHIICKKDL